MISDACDRLAAAGLDVAEIEWIENGIAVDIGFSGDLDVARIALLLNGDPALIAPLVEKGAHRRIINGAAAERAHHPLRAGGEEVDAAGNHAPEHLRVDIFKVQVVKAIKMAIQPADGVHARIEEMAGVET